MVIGFSMCVVCFLMMFPEYILMSCEHNWYDACWCYVVVWLGWCGIRMQAEALLICSCGMWGVYSTIKVMHGPINIRFKAHNLLKKVFVIFVGSAGEGVKGAFLFCMSLRATGYPRSTG